MAMNDRDRENMKRFYEAQEKREKARLEAAKKEETIQTSLSAILTRQETAKDNILAAANKQVKREELLTQMYEKRSEIVDAISSNETKLKMIQNSRLQKMQMELDVDNAKVAAVEAAYDAQKRIALTKNQAYQDDLLASKLADQRAGAEEAIADFVMQQRLEKELQNDPNTKILESMKKQAERQKQLDEFFGSFKDKFDDFADVIQDPKVATGLFAVAMTKELGKFTENMFKAGENIGLSRTQAVGLADEMASANIQGILFGITSEQNAASMAGLVEGAGNLKNLSGDTIVEVSKIAKNIGIGEQEAGKLVGHMSLVEGMTVAQSKATLETTANLARGANVPIGKVMTDVANNMELTSKFGNISADQLGKMAVEAAKLGTSLEQMSALGDKLMDIDNARASAMELSVMLGRQINVDRAQQLVYEGNIEGAYKEMLNQLGGINSFNEMDYFQKKQAAELMGVSVGELQKQLNLQAGLTETGEKQAEGFAKSAEYVSRMGKFLKENATTAAATVNFLGSMGKGITGAIPALGKFGGAMKDKLGKTKIGKFLGHDGKGMKGPDVSKAASKATGDASKMGPAGKKGGIKKSMQDLAAGLRSMGKGTFKGIAALALAGPALLLALPSIPFLMFMGLVPLAMLATNFKFLSQGLQSFGKGFASIMKGLLVLGLLGVAMIPAALAFGLLEGVDPLAMIAFSGSLVILGLAAAGLGYLFPFVALGAAALALLGVGLIPAAMAMGNLAGVDPAAIIGFSVGLGLLGGSVAGLGLMIIPISLGIISANLLGLAIAPATEALSQIQGVDTALILGFGASIAAIGVAVAGLGVMLPAIAMGVIGMTVMAGALPIFGLALRTLPDIDLISFAAGTAALGLAGMTLVPGAIGFTMMAGALTLFAASLLLLVPLMPVLDKLGSIGLFGMGEAEAAPAEGGGGGANNEQIIQKLDELISVIQSGGKVVMDGKEVGRVIQLAAGPIGS